MLEKAPLARIVIPFVIGIILTNAATIGIATAVISISAIILTMAAISLRLRKNHTLALNALPQLTALVMLAALIAGWLAGSSDVATAIDTGKVNGRTVIARIDAIENKDFSTAATSTIISCPTNHNAIPCNIPVSITIRANDYLLKEGDLIAFDAQLTRIKSLGNPCEFDYATYMQHKGILYTQLLQPGEYDKVGTSNNLLTTSRTIRRNIIANIINSSMHPDTQRFLCTVLLGESSYLEPETRTYYSQAGISHILALSGLHMGIIVGILFFVLKPLCYIGLHRVRIVIAIPCLIAYLFITGTLPSATRSAIMMLFVLTAHLLYRRNSSLNALLASAMIILSVSPNSIYDVGFQLSFAAVLAIILFYDRFVSISPRNKIAHFFISSFALTTTATLGTFVISAYYFHIVPLLSIVSNMIILPLLPIYIGTALLHTTLLCVGIEIHMLTALLDTATAAINTVAQGISDLSFASLTNVNVSTTTLVLSIIFYLVITIWIYCKKFRYAIASLALLTAISANILIEYTSLPHSGFVIQNSYTTTPVVYFTGDKCYVWCIDDSTHIDQFVRNNSGFLSRYGLKHVEAIDSLKIPDSFIDPPFSFIEGKRIAAISSTAWRHYRASSPIKVDYLVIAALYYGNISDLLHTFAPRQIVLSGGIYDDKAMTLKHEIDSLNIPLHDLSADGAIIVTQPRL